jgi:NAD(P)-dependent dehydrogenase (short-subunit alcohol dehydrogenase family)
MVTGANAGIGLEISRRLARRAADVVIAARTLSIANAACESIAAETGATMRHLPLDLSDLDSVESAAKLLSELLGGRSSTSLSRTPASGRRRARHRNKGMSSHSQRTSSGTTSS